MDAVAELHCPRCGWKGLVSDSPVLEGIVRRQALVGRHVRTQHRLLPSEEGELLQSMILGDLSSGKRAPLRLREPSRGAQA